MVTYQLLLRNIKQLLLKPQPEGGHDHQCYNKDLLLGVIDIPSSALGPAHQMSLITNHSKQVTKFTGFPGTLLKTASSFG